MFRVHVDQEGLEGLKEVLLGLADLGSEYKGAVLKPIDRKEGRATNAQVLDWLGESGRKFAEPFPSQIKDIESRALEELEDRTQKALDKARREAKRSARSLGKSLGLKGKALTTIGKQAYGAVTSFEHDDKWAKQTAAAILKECMKVYMQGVVENIEKQIAVGGIKDLTEQYAKRKIAQFGFAKPIGKASGQLLQNLDSVFAASRISLKKS